MTSPVFVLFTSSSSQHSVPCLNFISANPHIPIQVIRLDTSEVRERVLNNPNLKITSVPSLLVHLPNGKIQVYNGVEKIMGIFAQMTSPRVPHQAQQPQQHHQQSIDTQIPQRQSSRKSRVIEEDSESDDEYIEAPPVKQKRGRQTIEAALDHPSLVNKKTYGGMTQAEGMALAKQKAAEAMRARDAKLKSAGKIKGGDIMSKAKQMRDQALVDGGFDPEDMEMNITQPSIKKKKRRN